MTLYERYEAIQDEYHDLNIVMPSYIPLNLRQSLRPYQENALLNFLYWDIRDKKRLAENHILYQMATGSGKTMLMAALMLYLYQKGYRKFLFFVNFTTIQGLHTTLNTQRENSPEAGLAPIIEKIERIEKSV